jgi:CheY-like chemotaxis protein
MHSLALVFPGRGDLPTQGTSHAKDTIEAIRKKRCRILIVDDEAVFRSGVVAKLKHIYGATVAQAESGSLALQMTSADCPYHLILMDILMPGSLNGIEACKAMRAAGVRVPIVLMSAFYTHQHRQEAATLNIPVVNKPLDYKVLEEILLKCCGDDAS